MESELPYVVINGYRMKFSENIIFRSVLKTGINFWNALEVTKHVKNHVIGRKTVHAEELFEITKNALAEICGSEFAGRYELWHRYNVLRRKGAAPPLQILIGGSPSVGKSISLTDLAFRLAIARTITTDAIRRILKVIIRDDPVLHLPSYRVWKKLSPKKKSEHPRELEGFIRQAEFLKPFIIELVKKSIKDRKEVAVEGVHVTPWILPEELLEKTNVIQILLRAPARKIYYEMFFSKRLREGETEMESVAEDFEVCLKIDKFLVKEARKRKLPVIKFRSVEETVEKFLEVVNLRIRKLVRELDGRA